MIKYVLKAREFMRALGDKFLGLRAQDQPAAPAASPPAQKPPGLDCPKCRFRMPVSIQMLLSGQPVVCPSCGLRLTIERERSKACLDELRKVHDAVARVEKARGVAGKY
jgi:transcription elongation factor Elf1